MSRAGRNSRTWGNVARFLARGVEGAFERGERADFGGETGLERSNGVGGWKRVLTCEKL